MVKQRVKIIFLLTLIFSIMAFTYVITTYPSLKANDRFVGYAILFNVLICILIAFFVQQKLLRNMCLTIFGMGAFAFALVPLYDVFCETTGLNGKLDLSVKAATSQGVDLSRQVTVEFLVNHNNQMPWEFRPKNNALIVHPGELASTAYYAKNPTSRTMLAQAVPSISPSRASRYFKKVECFCFSQQKLGPGEFVHLGLRFYLSSDLPKDVQRITLAYTIFDVTNTIMQETHGHE